MQYWQQFSQDYRDKKVLVFGLGLQGGGVAVANTFARAGAQVRVSDQKTVAELQTSLSQLESSIEIAVGGHQESDIDWADCIIKNPGVPEEHPHIIKALTAHKPVLGEMALALTYIRDRSIAITGTRGKTTTTTLIAHLLTAAGLPIILAGNIPGKPLLAQLETAPDDAWFVIETSSFQIESLRITHISAHIAVITTLYPDHLNRYSTWENYARAKTDLFTYQKAGDISVFQADRDWSPTITQALRQDVTALPVTKQDVTKMKNRFQTPLQGEHNWENIAIAVKVAEVFAIAEPILQQAIQNFSGVSYRQENRGTIQGLTFINDTTSTTPTALEVALDTFKNEKFVLIAGGATKKLPLSETFLQKLTQTPLHTVLLTGSGAQELEQATQQLGLSWEHQTVDSLNKAFQMAIQTAKQLGATTILLSPGFASFEMFTNEFDRGDQFNALVETYRSQA